LATRGRSLAQPGKNIGRQSQKFRTRSVKKTDIMVDKHRCMLANTYQKNMTDNFCHGTSDNLFGGIDIETSRVIEVYGRKNNKKIL